MADIKTKILAAPEATTLTAAVLFGVQSNTKKKIPASLFAAASHAHTFASLTDKPTTLSGYGITDAQPLDSDLTAIAALTTTTFGRSLLTQADASALRSTAGIVIGSDVQAYNAKLAAFAALSDTAGVLTSDGAGNYSWGAGGGGGLVLGVSAISGGTGGALINNGGTLDEVAGGAGGVLIDYGGGSYGFGNITNSQIDASAAIAASKIAGLAASATTDTTDASNITSGTLALARLGGLGTGISTWLGTPTLANLNAAVSDADLATLGANTFTGVQLLPDGSASAPAAAFANDPNTGLYSAGADLLGIATGGAQRAQFGVVGGVGTCTLYTSSGNAIYTASGGGAQLGSTTVNASLTPYWTVTAGTGGFASSNRAYSFSLGGDCTLVGDAAHCLSNRSGTNAQKFSVYNTYTSATSYERLAIDWRTTVNTCMLGTEKGSGGGTARELHLMTDGTAALKIDTSGNIDFARLSATSAAAVASTHKIAVKIGGTTYYLLASNV